MSDVSPQSRELSVSSAKDGPNGALVSVRDSGTGLDGTVMDRLFEAFASLFARADEVEAAWSVIDPVLQAWAKTHEPKIHEYEPGLWGPEEATTWMREQGREWFDTCPVLK